MTKIRALSATLLALFAVATVALAQEVKTDCDHHANFSQYHTYYWEKVKTTDPLWESRVRDAVDHARSRQKAGSGSITVATSP